MGLPIINLVFAEKVTTAITRGERGVVAVLLNDAAGVVGEYNILSISDIPAGLSAANKTALTRILKGNVTAPSRLIVRVGNTSETDLTAALKWAETRKFTHIVAPAAVAARTTELVTWAKAQRNNGKRFMAVVAKNAADSPYIVNFTSTGLKENGVAVTTEEFVARIAGLIAGTPLNQSVTFSPLTELTEIESQSRSELDTRIDNGELVLYHDGEKAKVGRGVTSFKTTTATQGVQFKKIKIVETLDLIGNDIQSTIEDGYIGKVSNSYDNKIQLIVAIKGYLEGLENEGLLEEGSSVVEIDLAAQKAYLGSIGVDTASLSDDEIRAYNTRDKVFLKIQLSVLDSMEDFTLQFAL